MCETRKKYVVKHNLITEVYFNDCDGNNYMFQPVLAIIRLLGNLRASYMHARARGVEISTYAYLDKPNQNRSQIKHYEAEQIQNNPLLHN